MSVEASNFSVRTDHAGDMYVVCTLCQQEVREEVPWNGVGGHLLSDILRAADRHEWKCDLVV